MTCNTPNFVKQTASEKTGGEELFLTQCNTEITGDVKSENASEDFKSKTKLAPSVGLPLSSQHLNPELSDSKEHCILNEGQCKRAHQQVLLYMHLCSAMVKKCGLGHVVNHF